MAPYPDAGSRIVASRPAALSFSPGDRRYGCAVRLTVSEAPAGSPATARSPVAAAQGDTP